MSSARVHSEVPRASQWLGSLIFILQHWLPRSGFLETLRRRNVEAAVRALPSGGWLEVERRKDLGEDEFVRDYLNKGIPVIFDGLARDWPCTGKWNLDFLRDHCGDENFPVIDTPGIVEEEYTRTVGYSQPVNGKINAREFVDGIRQGATFYLRGCPIMEMRPELLKDLDLGWLKRMRRCILGVTFQTFIGAGNRTTRTHNETTAFFMVMAEGEKRWTLISPASSVILDPERARLGYHFSKVKTRDPDLARYPGFDRLTRLTCHIKKGDVLFVPPWWWHEVENLTESWSMSYRFTYLRGFLRYPVFAFARIFLAKPSFLETLYYSYFKGGMGTRDKSVLIPRIYLKD